MPSKRKKKWDKENQKKAGGEKAKKKNVKSAVSFNPNNYLEILLSAHAQPSETNILHLDQKAT